MMNKYETLIEENKGLVNFVLNNYYPSHRYDEDYYQEGLIGLWNAVQTFDESKNRKFSTYATRCIRHHLNGVYDMYNAKKRQINNTNNVISLDMSMQESNSMYEYIPNSDTGLSMLEIREYYYNQNSRNKTIIKYKTLGYSTETIAEKLGVSGQTIRRIWNEMKDEVTKCIS